MANEDYKNGKLVEIVREFNNTGNQYEVNGIKQAIAVPFWRRENDKFQVIPKGSYSFINEAGNDYLKILDSTILQQATQFQIVYDYLQLSSKYIEDFPDVVILTEKYNQLVDDTSNIFSYLKSVGMTSDTLQLTKVLAQLEPLTTWYMDEKNEIKALPISELYGKFNKMIDFLHKEIKKLLDLDYGNLSSDLRKELDKHIATLELELKKQLEILKEWGQGLPKRVDNLERNKLDKVNTIAELQSRKNLKVGDIVEVLGYYTAGDGAGHKRIISREDDGSGVQLTNGLWSNIVHNGEVNVSWFGAKGDRTDETSIFIAAQKIGGVVIVPWGEYLINDFSFSNGTTWKFQRSTAQQWFSDGENKTHTKILTSTGLKITGSAKIYNLNLKYDERTGITNIKDRPAGLIVNGSWSEIHSLHVSNFNTGVVLGRTGGCYYARLYDINSWYNYFAGISIEHSAATQVNFVSLFDVNSGASGTEPHNEEVEPTQDHGYGFYINGGNSIYINNCDISANSCCGIYLDIETTLKVARSVVFDSVYAEKNKLCNVFVNSGNEGQRSYGIDIRNCYFYNTDKSYFKGDWYNSGNRENYMCYGGNNIYPYIDQYVYDSGYCSLERRMRTYNSTYDEWVSIDELQKANATVLPGKSYILKFKAKTLNGSGSITFQNVVTNMSSVKNSLVVNRLGTLQSQTFDVTTTPKDYFMFVTIGNYDNVKSLVFDFAAYYSGKIFVKDISFVEYIPPVLIDFSNNISVEGGIRFFNGDLQFNTKNKWITFAGIGSISQLNNLYYGEKMKQEGVYNDFIAYMDEKTAYDKQQEKLEQERQIAYEQALKENPNLSYEEFMSVQPMTLNLIEEPQPSQALQEFMKKYL